MKEETIKSTNKDKQYRRFLTSDKSPKLPRGFYPLFYLKEKKRVYIFAIDKEKNYTISWDGVSEYPNEIQWQLKDKNDEYEVFRTSAFNRIAEL